MREVFISSVEEFKDQVRFAIKEIEASSGKPLIDTEDMSLGMEERTQNSDA